ncbi:MAG TPA: toll/interleukin-1 receptor domain-containing protein [Vicinamibacterales bacterium]|nr:toll/interleukin-1 receptor domain-containing protein [Vicinamibacterales bacterium]
MAHDVFISYASSDKVVADAVCSQLESIHRIRCWIAPRDVTPGASWAESIIDALDGSKIMVLIFSSNANASMQIEREVERAVHKGINIIPLRIEDTIPTKTLEYFISAPHWLDALSTPLESHISRLAISVKALLAKHGQTNTPQSVARMVPTQSHPVVPPAVVAPPVAPRKRLAVVPLLVLAVIVAGAAAFGIRSSLRTPPVSKPDPAPPASSTAPAAAIPATAPIVPKPDPAVRLSTAMPSTPAAAAAPPPVDLPASTRNPNFLIDLHENLPAGSITVVVDGQNKWTQKVGAKVTGGSQRLTEGPHKVTVTLLSPDGKVRQTKAAPLRIHPGRVSTLRVRLSRFKRNLELQTVLGMPATTKPAAMAKPTAISDAKAKP